jgi:CHASE3 domain sensor protein
MHLAQNQAILNTNCGSHLGITSISEADAIIRKALKPKPTTEPTVTKPDESLGKKVEPIMAAAIKALPKDVNKRTVSAVVRGVKKLAEELQHDYSNQVAARAKELVKGKAFNDAVNLAVQEKFNETLKEEKLLLESKLNEAERRIKVRSKQVDNFSSLMTEDEYKLVLNCLHPDREDVDKKRLSKAFKIFRKMKDYVPNKMLKAERDAFGWPNKKDKEKQNKQPHRV